MLAVVLYHFSPGVMPGGFLGVDIFFVLSGFLITSLLVREREGGGRVSLAAFWTRRARRLLPALFALLGVVGLWALLIANPVDGQRVANDGLATFTYVANWHFIVSGQSYIQHFTHQAPSPLLHTWSLAIEEQFYLVWPLLVVLVAGLAVKRSSRAGRQRRRLQRSLFTVCAVLAAASLARMVSLYHPGTDPSRVYYGTDTRAFVVFIGAALGAVTAGAPVIKSRRLRSALVVFGSAGAIGLVGAMATVTTQSSWLYAGGYGGLAVLIGLVLSAVAQPGPNPLRRLLETRPIVALGLISYGVYLWHWPAVTWITSGNSGTSGVGLFAFRAAFTVAASLVSYFLIEQPIRHGRLPRVRFRNPGIVPVAMITVVALTLLVPSIAFPSTVAAPSPLPPVSSEAVTATYAGGPRCDGPQPSPATAAKAVHVEVAGNSLAVEILPCLRTILAAHGARIDSAATVATGICDQLPRARTQIRRSHPTVAVLFALPFYFTRCSEKQSWTSQVQSALTMFKQAGVPAYLAPALPKAGMSAADATAASYTTLVQRAPAASALIDAGLFLRDQTGRYQWRMPCVRGEAGCSRSETLPVRNPIDRGVHFCADPAWQDGPCASGFAGGERRVAAAIAIQILAALRSRTS